MNNSLSRLNSLKNPIASLYRPALMSSSAGTRSLSKLNALVIFSYSFASISTAIALPFTVRATGRFVLLICSRIDIFCSPKYTVSDEERAKVA